MKIKSFVPTARSGHYLTLLISLFICKWKARIGFPSLNLDFWKLNAWVQLCPSWLSLWSVAKKRHLQNSSRFQRDICRVHLVWPTSAGTSDFQNPKAERDESPASCTWLNRTGLNTSMFMFGTKVEVGIPVLHALQSHQWKMTPPGM